MHRVLPALLAVVFVIACGSEDDDPAPVCGNGVVESGELEILKRSRTRDVLVKTSGPGAVIGEMAILQATPRTATVRAVTDAVLLAIDGEAFRRFIDESPEAAGKMLETMFDRWRETDAALRESDRLAQLGVGTLGVTDAQQETGRFCVNERVAQRHRSEWRLSSGQR